MPTQASMPPTSPPLPDKAAHDWTGIAYQIGPFEVVSPMHQVSEMFTCPDSITPVPGTQPWFLGVANTGNKLLSIIDLALYLQLGQTAVSPMARILRLEMHDLHVGLLVPSVLGMRHFDATRHLKTLHQSLGYAADLDGYMKTLFKTEQGGWPVFNLSTLLAEQRFRDAALDSNDG